MNNETYDLGDQMPLSDCTGVMDFTTKYIGFIIQYIVLAWLLKGIFLHPFLASILILLNLRLMMNIYSLKDMSIGEFMDENDALVLANMIVWTTAILVLKIM